MNFRDTLCEKNGSLQIGGCDAVALAEYYGTPLYVLDESYIRDMCRAFVGALKRYGDAEVLYASKALSCKGIYHLVKSEGIGTDVVSGCELMTALSAGMKPEKIYFHGNNKSRAELYLAARNGVNVVIDSLSEADELDKISCETGVKTRVLVRINPGVEAHTHAYIQTARPDSKFGFNVSSGAAEQAVLYVASKENLEFRGVHAHIGSQIFDEKAFRLEAQKMTDFIAVLKADGITVEELDMGGGFGVYYSGDDLKLKPCEYVKYIDEIIDAVNEGIQKHNLHKPKLLIEPGRSIVAEAGVTLYTVGRMKEIEGIRKYIAVDGGMFDNARVALYQAKYSCCLANRMNDPAEEVVTVAGKCCESGDILVENVSLPKANEGDILAVFTTGAYNYSMASNYNRNAVPPMVICADGRSDFLVKPQTYEDIMRNDVVPTRFLKD